MLNSARVRVCSPAWSYTGDIKQQFGADDHWTYGYISVTEDLWQPWLWMLCVGHRLQTVGCDSGDQRGFVCWRSKLSLWWSFQVGQRLWRTQLQQVWPSGAGVNPAQLSIVHATLFHTAVEYGDDKLQHSMQNGHAFENVFLTYKCGQQHYFEWQMATFVFYLSMWAYIHAVQLNWGPAECRLDFSQKGHIKANSYW